MSTKHTVLIIDDEPFNVEIITEHLTEEDYTILSAENGKIGLDVLAANKNSIDVILLDRMMPVMTGMEFLAEIKKDDSVSNIPIIMQTAADAASDIIEGINAGAYYYLTKPFETEILHSIVKAAISDFECLKATIDSSLSFDVVCDLISDIEFHFQNLDEANTLAKMLSNLYPTPVKVIMGITELLINSVEHGNLEITYSEKTALLKKGIWAEEVSNRLQLEHYKEKFTTVKLSREDSCIKLIIQDQGAGFDYEKYLTVDPTRAFDPHGRGIAVAAMISFSKVEFIGNGNEVHCFVNTS